MKIVVFDDNEKDLNEIGDNVQKEIKIYTNLIDNL